MSVVEEGEEALTALRPEESTDVNDLRAHLDQADIGKEPAQNASGVSEDIGVEGVSVEAEKRVETALSCDETTSELNRSDSGRRRLEKQRATLEEAVTSAVAESTSVLPDVVETTSGSENAQDRRQSTEDDTFTRTPRQQLTRGNAVCGDDDTRLRPPPMALIRNQTHSTSKDSTGTVGTDITDSAGINVKQFVVNTLHKNKRDRESLLKIEEKLIAFLQDERTYEKFEDMSSYNRMLVHRAAALFGLDHNVNTKKTAVIVTKNVNSRIPEFALRDLIEQRPFEDEPRKMRSTGHSNDEMRRSFGSYSQSQSFDSHGVVSGDGMSPLPMHRSFDQPCLAGSQPPPPLVQSTWGLSSGHRGSLKKAGSFGGMPHGYTDPMVHRWDSTAGHQSPASPYNLAHAASLGSQSSGLPDVAEHPLPPHVYIPQPQYAPQPQQSQVYMYYPPSTAIISPTPSQTHSYTPHAQMGGGYPAIPQQQPMQQIVYVPTSTPVHQYQPQWTPAEYVDCRNMQGGPIASATPVNQYPSAPIYPPNVQYHQDAGQTYYRTVQQPGLVQYGSVDHVSRGQQENMPYTPSPGHFYQHTPQGSFEGPVANVPGTAGVAPGPVGIAGPGVEGRSGHPPAMPINQHVPIGQTRTLNSRDGGYGSMTAQESHESDIIPG